MTHLKRNKIGTFWPIPRKGTAYLAVPSHNKKNSIPLVVVMREMMGLVKNKKELKRLLNEKKILINHKIVREVNYPASLFDILTFVESNKNYQIILSANKKMNFKQISDKEAETKIYKILDKKILPNKKIQLNLNGGKNIIFNEKVRVGDSVVFNFKNNKIETIIPMEKGRNAFVINGKHMGAEGKIEDIIERGGKKLAKIISDKGKINVWVKNIIVGK